MQVKQKKIKKNRRQTKKNNQKKTRKCEGLGQDKQFN